MNEREIWLALRELNKTSRPLTRTWQTEVRHELLYVSQTAASIRTEVLRPDATELGIAVELEELITKLRVLRDYIRPASREDQAPRRPQGTTGQSR